jgi:hypothetical protein
MFKKINKKTKSKIIASGILAYILFISFFTFSFINYNTEVYNIENYDQGITVPGGNGTTEPEVPDSTQHTLFNPQVLLMSNLEPSSRYSMRLFTIPGYHADLYRDFSVFIYSNQPAKYIIKMDGQTYSTGTLEWMKRIEMRSEYRNIDVDVILENATGITRTFSFENIRLVDSPWVRDEDKKDDDDDRVTDILDPYVKMSRGEMNIFIAKRVFADVVAVIMGILFGIQMAAVKADLAGISRVM